MWVYIYIYFFSLSDSQPDNHEKRNNHCGFFAFCLVVPLRVQKKNEKKRFFRTNHIELDAI